MRKVAINVLLSLTALLLSLLFVEIGSRLFLATGPRSGYLVPKASRQQLTPRTAVINPNYSGTLVGRDFKIPYRVNSLGFREKELDFVQLSGRHPYLFVGDSYFNGWGVDIDARMSERFSERLHSTGLQTPVINLSLPGYGTYQYLDILKIYAIKLSPRLVVIGFFVGNDFLDDLQTVRSEQDSNSVRTRSTESVFVKLKGVLRILLRNSEVANLAKYALWEVPSFRHAFDKLELRNDRVVLYERGATSNQAEFYNSSFAAFDQLRTFSQMFQVPILVVIIPDHIQVLRRDLFSEYDFDKPQRMLKAHLDELGIHYIDLREYFLGARNAQELFFKEDKHWSTVGHEFVAGILYQHIVMRGAP